MLHRPKTVHQQAAPEAIENEVVCMRLARSIIDDFSNVPEEHPKYTFPFLHYLTSATIIALGLIIKQPSFKSAYGPLTLEAARSLSDHCRKTWVSGKMAQTVWKLNQMADATMGPRDQLPQGVSSSANTLSATPLSSRFTSTRLNSVPCRPQDRASPISFQPPTPNARRLTNIVAGAHTDAIDLESGTSLPGEMIDGGMEWLQTLFANGLDTELPPVWD